MDLKAQKVTMFRLETEDHPGAAAAIARKLRDAHVNLIGLWGFGMNGRAGIALVPENPDALRRAAGIHKFDLAEGTAFLVQGEDRVGALCETLDAVARAGVNVHAVGAVSARGVFGSLFWADEKDVSRVAEVLGAP